jgi:hypothetical protein
MQALQAKSVTLDAQVAAAQKTLRELKAKKGANLTTITTQTAATNALEDQLGAVHRQINALDGTIALGGCVA